MKEQLYSQYRKILFYLYKKEKVLYFICIIVCIFVNNINNEYIYSYCVGNNDIVVQQNVKKLSLGEIEEFIRIVEIFKDSELQLNILESFRESFKNIAKAKLIPNPNTALLIEESAFEQEMTDNSLKFLFSEFNCDEIFITETLSATQSMEVAPSTSPENSIGSFESTNAVSRPPSPDDMELYKKFSEEIFKFLQVTQASELALKNNITIDQFSNALYHGFHLLDSNLELSIKDKVLVVGQFASQHQELVIYSPEPAEPVVAGKYLIETFRIYRQTFYNTPSGLGIAVRSGINALSKINLVGNPGLPDSSMPTSIRFVATAIYKKILTLGKNMNYSLIRK